MSWAQRSGSKQSGAPFSWRQKRLWQELLRNKLPENKYTFLIIKNNEKFYISVPALVNMICAEEVRTFFAMTGEHPWQVGKILRGGSRCTLADWALLH